MARKRCLHAWTAVEVEDSNHKHGVHICGQIAGHDGMCKCAIPDCKAKHTCRVEHSAVVRTEWTDKFGDEYYSLQSVRMQPVR